MARDKTIQFYRRIGGVAGAPASLLEGEPGYNDNLDTLHIGSAAGAVHLLVGAQRQIELTGAQTITTGAGNAKTFDLTNLKVGGGAAGDILTRGAVAGDLVWAAAPSTAVAVNAPLSGNGLVGTELGVTPATYGTGSSQVELGVNNVYPVTPAGLAAITGSPATLTTTATTIIPAINELRLQLLALEAAIQFVGTVNGTSGAVVAAAGSPATTGPLPAPIAANTGWLFIATQAGPGGNANLPAGPIAVGDLIISTGSAWVLIPLGLTPVAAGNVTLTAVDSQPWANVQVAIQALFDDKADASDLADYLPLIGGALSGPGNLTVGGTLGVTGNTTLTGTLGVTGAITGTSATLSTTLGVTGATTLSSATLSSTLAVTGASTLSGGASVVGAALIAGAPSGTPVTAAGNVNISGQYYINGVPLGTALSDTIIGNIFVDDVSIVGDGLTAGTAFMVDVVDGGTF